jgi:hypothetical protein
MLARWQRGREDANVTLQASPWLAPINPHVGTRVFDVLHDIYMAELGTAKKKERK